VQRRTLLQLGLGATALLAIAGSGLALLKPSLVGGRLTASAQSIFRAVGRAVLEGSLPADGVERERALEAHLTRVDDTLAAFPASTQAELSQLLSLLACAPGRLGLAGLQADWPDASLAELQRALQGMRVSRLATRQQIYHALRDLTNAAFYADPSAWPLLGYPGPQSVE